MQTKSVGTQSIALLAVLLLSTHTAVGLGFKRPEIPRLDA